MSNKIEKRIKEIRKEKKLSQEEFGKKVGVSGVQISRIEQDKSYPSKELINSICDVFSLDKQERDSLLKALMMEKVSEEQKKHMIYKLGVNICSGKEFKKKTETIDVNGVIIVPSQDTRLIKESYNCLICGKETEAFEITAKTLGGKVLKGIYYCINCLSIVKKKNKIMPHHEGGHTELLIKEFPRHGGYLNIFHENCRMLIRMKIKHPPKMEISGFFIDKAYNEKGNRRIVLCLECPLCKEEQAIKLGAKFHKEDIVLFKHLSGTVKKNDPFYEQEIKL